MSGADDDGRTPGWPEGWMDNCWRWTADQHAQVAADLLDGTFVPTASEDGWDGKPAHRHYSVYDSRDQEPGEQDYAPLLAALVHVGLANYKATHQTTESAAALSPDHAHDSAAEAITDDDREALLRGWGLS